jgi:uncharacterized membrane protein
MSTWKYTQNGQQLGPVDTTVLLNMLRNGTVSPETTVCKEGTANWVPIRTVSELSSATGAGIPPTSSSAAPLNDGDTPDPADVDKNKIFAVLAYISILFLVPLLAAKESRFARYHTNQGVVLFLAGVICGIAGMILSFIPFVGCLVMPAVLIAILVFVVLGIINAAQGVCKPLPLIGQFKLIK